MAKRGEVASASFTSSSLGSKRPSSEKALSRASAPSDRVARVSPVEMSHRATPI